MAEQKRKISDFLAFAAIFLLAFALRAYGVGGWLPYVAHPDEPKLIDSAIHIVKTGDLNPNLYIWPSLYIYLEALVLKSHLWWGMLRGTYAGASDLPDVTHIFTLAPGVYVWARTFSAAVGASAVALLYVVGKDIFNGNRRVGVAAALMLAVTPLHIEYSHYALLDAPLSLAGLLVLWASYHLSRARVGAAGWRTPLLWQAVLSGLLVGLAAGTKYNGAYLLIVPLTAWMLVWWRSRRDASAVPAKTAVRAQLASSLAAIPLAAVAGFLLSEPYALLDWPSFSSGFVFQVKAYLPVQNLEQMGTSVQRQINDLGTGSGHFLLPAFFGAVLLLLSPPVRNRAWLLLPFPVFYILAMARFTEIFPRNLNVILPFLAISAGYAIDTLAMQALNTAKGLGPLPVGGARLAMTSRRLWGVARWALVAIALGFLLFEPLRVSTAYSRYMGSADSRTLAWNWMKEQIRLGYRFAAELHPLQVRDWPDVLAYDVENPDGTQRLTALPPEWYSQHGYDYIVLNSDLKDVERDPAVWPLYQKLPEVEHFAGDKEGGKGPTISVRSTGRRVTGGGPEMPPVLHKSAARVEDFGELVGYDLAPVKDPGVLVDPVYTKGSGTFKAGEAIGLNLYYRALRDGGKTDPNWQVWIHLVDGAGSTVAQLDTPPLTGQLYNYPHFLLQPHPVSQWHQGEFIAGVYNVALPASLSPSKYHLQTGMWVPPNGPGAKISYAAGSSPGANAPDDRIELGEIEVR